MSNSTVSGNEYIGKEYNFFGFWWCDYYLKGMRALTSVLKNLQWFSRRVWIPFSVAAGRQRRENPRGSPQCLFTLRSPLGFCAQKCSDYRVKHKICQISARFLYSRHDNFLSMRGWLLDKKCYDCEGKYRIDFV